MAVPTVRFARIVHYREGTELLRERLVAGILFSETKDRATRFMESEAQSD